MSDSENNSTAYNDMASEGESTDHDVLVEMRGGGRYFGLEEDLGPVCRNCHGRGHIARECKVVICETCGEANDHYTKQCPKSQKCTNCGQTGHLRSACTNKSKQIFCTRCESRNHTESHCPMIWRSYRVQRDKVKYPKSINCYNCGMHGHYGDDCKIPRRIPLRFREYSAFNGENLSRSLRSRYRREIRHPKHPLNGSSGHKRKPHSGSGPGSKFAQRLDNMRDKAKRIFKNKDRRA